MAEDGQLVAINRGANSVIATFEDEAYRAPFSGNVTELSPDAALLFGHWQLTRAHDTPHGLFTLLVRRTPAGWKIFADHTSSASP